MESEHTGGITAALDKLEADILEYMNQRIAAQSPDQAQQFLWGGGNKRVNPPAAYTLYRRLKLYAGRDGTLPFLWSGGYMDQPYLGTLTLERCEVAIQNFQTVMAATMPQKPSIGDDEPS